MFNFQFISACICQQRLLRVRIFFLLMGISAQWKFPYSTAFTTRLVGFHELFFCASVNATRRRTSRVSKKRNAPRSEPWMSRRFIAPRTGGKRYDTWPLMRDPARRLLLGSRVFTGFQEMKSIMRSPTLTPPAKTVIRLPCFLYWFFPVSGF